MSGWFNMSFETFIGRVVSVSVNKKGREYEYFRVVIPADVSKKLRLKRGDYVVVALRKAEWYHLLDMDENPEIWFLLPENVKEELRALGLAPKVQEYITKLSVEIVGGEPVPRFYIVKSESELQKAKSQMKERLVGRM